MPSSRRWHPPSPPSAVTTAKPRLTVERIVDTALAQIRDVGYDAVSMRTIARALGTGPASLYAHVASKAALDQYLIARMAREVVVPAPDPARWKDQLIDVMTQLAVVYREYPGVAGASFGMVPIEPDSLRVGDGMLGIMLAAGISHRLASWALDTLNLYVGAAAYEESIWAQRAAEAGIAPEHAEEETVASIEAYFMNLPADLYPNLAAVSTELSTGDGEERFQFGLRAMLDGIEAMNAHPAAAAKAGRAARH